MAASSATRRLDGKTDGFPPPSELAHPLGPKLHRAFRDLSSSNDSAGVSQGLSELQAIIEDDSEIMLHRAHAVNTTHKGLGRWISRWLSCLAEDAPASAVHAIEALREVEFTDETTRTVLLTRLLARVIVTCDLEVEASVVTAVRAAEVWGSVIGCGNWLVLNIVESQIHTAVEWLCADPTGRHRFVANLFLQQAGSFRAGSVVPRLKAVLSGLWVALRDTHASTRIASALTLRMALDLGTTEQYQEQQTPENILWRDVLSTIAKLVAVPQGDTRHGGLLALHGALTVAVKRGGANGYRAIDPDQIAHLWDLVLDSLREPSLPDVVFVALTDLLPLMARYDRARFVAHSIGPVTVAATQVFRGASSTQAERSQMFVVVGELGRVLHDYIPNLIERVIKSITLNLSPNTKLRRDRCDEAATCLAMLAQADPTSLRPYVLPLMDSLFTGNITVNFAKDIQALCDVYPELQSMCLDRVIGVLQTKLAPSTDASEVELTAMLDALVALDFAGYSAVDFLVSRVLPHMANSSSAVRAAAARCCANLVFSGCVGWRSPCRVDSDGAIEHQGRQHTDAVLAVQVQLLNVAVADPDSDVRLLALTLLQKEFDATLASQEPCRTLFPALNDKPAIRHAAMRLLGRLSRRNPGCVYPMLRRTIIQCSTELHLLDHVRRQEQAATLLGTLVDAAPALVAPYAPALLTGMAQKLTATDPPTPSLVLTAVLATVGRLVLHVPEEALGAVSSLTSAIVRHVVEEGPQGKRIEAIRALTSIVRATHDTALYDRHPTLLRCLTDMLHGGRKEGWATRHEVLALLGVIGAIDPARVKHLEPADDDSSVSGQTATAMSQLAFGRGLDDEALARYALNTALAVVAQASVEDECCKHASLALVRIFDTRKLQLRASVAALRRVIPEVLAQIELRPKIREELFTHLALFTDFVSQHVRTFLPDIHAIVAKHIDDEDPGVVRAVVRLLVELRRHLNEEFAPYVPHLLPLMSRVAETRLHDREAVISVLNAFQAFGSLIGGHVHIVLPSIVDFAADTSTEIEIRLSAIRTLRRLACELPALAGHASRVIHTLCRVVGEIAPAVSASSRQDQRNLAKTLATEAYEALRSVMILLGPRYARYDHSVRHVMAERYKDTPHRLSEFIAFSDTIVADRQPPQVEAPPPLPFAPLQPDADDGLTGGVTDLRFNNAVEHLNRIHTLTEDEWPLWLRQFCIVLLADCQARPLRMCLTLARVHEPSARALFHPTFAACFATMPGDMMRLVVQRLNSALDSERTPKEVVQELLNLVEYMERIEDMKLRSQNNRDRNRRGVREVLAPFSADIDKTVWCLENLFDLRALVKQSERCNLHAKALHYAELQFQQLTRLPMRAIASGRPVALTQVRWDGVLHVCEKIIGLYSRLGQQESANGVLQFLQRNYATLTGSVGEFRVRDAEMYEKLHWWSEAHRVYQRQYRHQHQQSIAIQGMLRSLDAMGDFDGVSDLWRTTLKHRSRVPKRDLPSLAQFGARAAWLLQRWDDLKDATDLMSTEGYEHTTRVFYLAMLAMRDRDSDRTRALITECRRFLDRDLSAVIAESYDRAYPLLIGLHQLAELEELAGLDSCAALKLSRCTQLWKRRLQSLSTSAVEWQGTLANHSVAVPLEEDLDTWIRFITICVRGGRYRMADTITRRLLHAKPDETIGVAIARCKPCRHPASLAVAAAQFLFEVVNPEQAVDALHSYADIISEEIEAAATVAATATQPATESPSMGSPPTLAAPMDNGSFAGPRGGCATSASRDLAVTLTKLAEYRTIVSSEFTSRPDDFAYIHDQLRRARAADGTYVTAWRQWARVSKEFATAHRTGRRSEIESHVVAGVDGYLRCIASEEMLLQDVLSLLSLWFAYGGVFTSVAERIDATIHLVPNDAWLRVIPQIMARIHTPEAVITQGVHKLLHTIAENHPQSLLFPLNVSVNATATGEDVSKRREGAFEILRAIEGAHGTDGERMVDHAELVSQELIGCAIIAMERWFDTIEEAWRVFLFHQSFKGDVRAMYNFFEPLVTQLDTPRNGTDLRFAEKYGNTVRAAYDHMCAALHRLDSGQLVTTTPEEMLTDPDIKAAWELLTKVWQELEPECKSISALALALVSPRLDRVCSEGRALAVVVPGHYNPAGTSPYIKGFDSDLKVMGSKNRPRKVGIIGDDGTRYKHMVKGLEDMRLDERVMQLLGLVNTLFEDHIRTSSRNMHATTYAVTPLSDNVGLVGWVDNCDTLHDVIRRYRAATDDHPASREYKTIESESGGAPEHLALMQKLEIFEFAMDDSDGMEVARSMWVRAPSAEALLDSRTAFVRTLASMSIVGNVLGLGDRHPSNLMLSRHGRVVHIDFGDCFEVAMLRTNMPERVPFRLTRMLQNALEPAGIDGLFRHTCEAAMGVLRAERDNLTAMLEAFVHDPLITWRLVATDDAANEGLGSATAASTAAGAPASVRAVDGHMASSIPATRQDGMFEPGSLRATSVLLTHSIRVPQAADGAVAAHTRRAREVVDRVRDKLVGKEDPRIPPVIEERVPRPQVSVPDQVTRLINQATSNEKLCQAWKGWCAFW